MAHHCIDNLSLRNLTPKEPNIELLEAACEGNIIVCLGNGPGKTFIASKLVQDTVNKADRNEGTITLYISDCPTVVSKQAAYFQRLTNMVVFEYHWEDKIQLKKFIKKPGVDIIFVLETDMAFSFLEKEILIMSDINLLILSDCQTVLKSGFVPMKEIMKYYFKSSKKPRVLGLASSLFSSELDLSKIKSSLSKLEDLLDCKAETASNVLSHLKYGTQPQEIIIEHGSYVSASIDQIIETEIMNAINFIKDHRYDPLEMYEGFSEEIQNIPDPKQDPEEIFSNLLDVLHTLGPWCADRAASVLLLHIEKLKVTTPYERHFLLLCMTSSILIKIRAIFDDFFNSIDEKDRIYKFSSPKILRVIEILRLFTPEKTELDCNESSENEREVNESIVSSKIEKWKTTDESVENVSKNVLELNTKSGFCNCECELITEFLLKRSQFSLNVSYDTFVKLMKNKPRDDSDVDSNFKKCISINQCTDSREGGSVKSAIDKNNHSLIECKLGNCQRNNLGENDKSLINPSLEEENENERGKKFGPYYLKMGGRAKVKKNQPKADEKKINELNTIEKFLQYHEYLLLPKFKVDKHARYDRFNMANHLKGAGQEEFVFRQTKNLGDGEAQLCGLILVENKFTAKVLFHVLNDLKQADEDFSFLSVQFSVGKLVDGSKDPKGAENEHRKQELMLKRFRMRSCNLLIGTSFLEEGIDLPKCNLVIRFDIPKNYRSYINSKERARATDSLHCLLVDTDSRENFITDLGKYQETEAMLLEKCGRLEPTEEEQKEADEYSQLIQPFCPLLKKKFPHVDLYTAIGLVNRYCAKLPSDTFTRLTPTWSIKTQKIFEKDMFICTIRLPINSPVKQEIQGCPMPTVVLARRFAAFQCCQILHLSGELDDTLQPITKESFWMREEEQLTSINNEFEEVFPKDSLEPRPGTTKRRQYYYKKIADSLTDCLPSAGQPSFLYDISMALTCPLPEEQNTRGRKIHPPENSSQGFGILTRKRIPKIGPFPIFTRSGEVQVTLQLAQSTVVLSQVQIEKIVAFIHYTFTSVLRLQKYLMMFDPKSSENSYFIVPIKKGKIIEVDWDFLELIFEKRNKVPVFIPEEERKNFIFDATKFEDAVISPWYRNQDQPQYLYVAEICTNLNPKSAFPGAEYETFEEYYLKKYNIQIQNTNQALLDVDHTSARLNFLTPRYVNRKGVALPTTSEEKKKAKRENLKQKQILVPELCEIHPFPATLWRKAVCLPCILHRINALLLADQVRRIVATEIGVGTANINDSFNWKPLNFGWNLADVLKQTKALQKQQQESNVSEEKERSKCFQTSCSEKVEDDKNIRDEESKSEMKGEGEEEEEEGNEAWIEMGIWSNDMVNNKLEKNKCMKNFNNIDDLRLPTNVTMIEAKDVTDWNSEIQTDKKAQIRYCSPTCWLNDSKKNDDENLTDYLSDGSYSDDFFEMSSVASDSDSSCGGLKIEFKDDNVAEAVECNKTATTFLKEMNDSEDQPWIYEESDNYLKHVKEFNKNLDRRKKDILNSKNFFNKDKPLDLNRSCESGTKKFNDINWDTLTDGISEEDSPFGSIDNTFPRLIDDIPEEIKELPYTATIIRSLFEERSRGKKEMTNEEPKVSNCSKFKNLDVEEVTCDFSFDKQPDLNGHPGPSPSLILQALTMSNANDGINLERLETIGDSFLKYAITTYLYCVYENVHEGKLSHLRSKQVSNFNLYRLGRRKVLGESMIATKFEPHDNWLPPCYYVPRELERALIEAGVPASQWNRADLPSLRNLTKEEICQLVKEKGEKLGFINSSREVPSAPSPKVENIPYFIPYNLMTQHSIPDKSIADCVEALIGAYLVACGPRGALLFMSWLGIKVLPKEEKFFQSKNDPKIKNGVGCSLPVKVITEEGEIWSQVCFGELQSPKQPLIRHVPDPEGELEQLLRGFDVFEDSIQYRFRDRSYLLQSLTHASYYPNRLTDCYQRLEFLGDAVLDYLITRHLYEDPRHHSPGALTDLRSALVNNTIFASLAVRHNFHKYFRHLCPSLNEVLDRFVRFQQENNHSINEEFYLIEEEECEEAEDVEVPKALGDVFESVAGAIFLDSGMSLDAVWRVYYRIMKNEIELFSTNVPKSPIRELFELEPETAQFGKPEKLADGRRVRVSVEVFGKGIFNGIGRNYRIAKCTAAKCALKQLKRKGLLERRK